MKKETNFETSPLNTQDAKAEAATTLAPDATNGDKIKALRTAQHMSMAELARRASMSDRAIRYIESNQREPSVDAIQKIAAALGVTTDYFMDEATFQQELNDLLCGCTKKVWLPRCCTGKENKRTDHSPVCRR